MNFSAKVVLIVGENEHKRWLLWLYHPSPLICVTLIRWAVPPSLHLELQRAEESKSEVSQDDSGSDTEELTEEAHRSEGEDEGDGTQDEGEDDMVSWRMGARTLKGGLANDSIYVHFGFFAAATHTTTFI